MAGPRPNAHHLIVALRAVGRYVLWSPHLDSFLVSVHTLNSAAYIRNLDVSDNRTLLNILSKQLGTRSGIRAGSAQPANKEEVDSDRLGVAGGR